MCATEREERARAHTQSHKFECTIYVSVVCVCVLCVCVCLCGAMYVKFYPAIFAVTIFRFILPARLVPGKVDKSHCRRRVQKIKALRGKQTCFSLFSLSLLSSLS